MDIYIKSFNRPFLLDRCLASIYKYVTNFSRIVVMDDGTPELYIDKIKKKYPKVVFEFSENYVEKSKDITYGRYPKKEIPALLWKNCIEKGTPYFILLEDDMWFTDCIDAKVLQRELSEEKLSMIKFMWLENKRLVSSFVVNKRSSLIVTRPHLITYNAVLFKKFFVDNVLNIQGIIKRLGIYWNDLLLPYYQVYIVAGGAFSKEYYAACWNEHQKTVNEFLQIHQLLRVQKKIKLKVGHSHKEIIKASYKTTASSQSKDYLKNEFDVYHLNALLNAAWFKNEVYALDDFQNDISDGWIEKVLSDNGQDMKMFDSWKEWYRNFKKTYQEIGCNITNDK